MKASQFEQIVQIIFPQSQLRRFWPLQGGISAGMTALEVVQADGEIGKFIVRSHQHPMVAENEFRLLQAISGWGLAAPIPYYLDLSGQILAAPFLVLGYCEGEMDFGLAGVHGRILQMAAQLARIHSLGRLSFLPQSGAGCAELAREPAQLDESLAEGRIRQALTAASAPPANPRTLLHGDFWPGNCLWLDGRLTAVIDWEDAQLGEPLIDLAQSRSEIVWIFGVDAMDAFTRHYQSLMDLDYRGLPYWDLCAALRFLRLAAGDLAGLAAYFTGYGRADITAQSIRKYMGDFITQALEQLAVKND